MTDTNQNIKDIQLKMWMNKTPGVRLLTFLTNIFSKTKIIKGPEFGFKGLSMNMNNVCYPPCVRCERKLEFQIPSLSERSSWADRNDTNKTWDGFCQHCGYYNNYSTSTKRSSWTDLKITTHLHYFHNHRESEFLLQGLIIQTDQPFYSRYFLTFDELRLIFDIVKNRDFNKVVFIDSVSSIGHPLERYLKYFKNKVHERFNPLCYRILEIQLKHKNIKGSFELKLKQIQKQAENPEYTSINTLSSNDFDILFEHYIERKSVFDTLKTGWQDKS